MTVIIEKLKVTNKWFSIWLMYVTGVNLKNHCKQCLKGHTSKKINKETKKLENIKLDEAKSKYYYLCGVVSPYSWGDNFHLAWKEKKNEKIEYESNGISIKLRNAERINFSEDDINFELEHSDKLEYYSCRNWQFANKIVKEDEKKKNKKEKELTEWMKQ